MTKLCVLAACWMVFGCNSSTGVTGDNADGGDGDSDASVDAGSGGMSGAGAGAGGFLGSVSGIGGHGGAGAGGVSGGSAGASGSGGNATAGSGGAAGSSSGRLCADSCDTKADSSMTVSYSCTGKNVNDDSPVLQQGTIDFTPTADFHCDQFGVGPFETDDQYNTGTYSFFFSDYVSGAAPESLLPTEICSDGTSSDRFVSVNDFNLNGNITVWVEATPMVLSTSLRPDEFTGSYICTECTAMAGTTRMASLTGGFGSADYADSTPGSGLAFSGDCIFSVTWVAGDCDLDATCSER